MKLAGYITIIAFLLLFAGNVTAQEQDGVVVHTDPRLSVLIKKESVASAVRTNHHITGETRIGHGHSHLIAEATPHRGSGSESPIAETVHTSVGITHPEAVAAHPAPNTKYRTVPPPFIREREGRVIYSGKGYRVQIYNGPDRGKAIAVKAEFMRNNPGVRTYLTYVSPCFRVKVGNYRNRSDALGMLREANSMYSPCVIVPDIITINTH